MAQWIMANYSPAIVAEKKKFLGSALREFDMVSQGLEPTQAGSGVLISWKSTPIAFTDRIPTLNRMVFTAKLWGLIRENPFVKVLLEGRCHYGEDRHRESDEVFAENVSCRITDFHVEGDMVLGDVDLMDTPRGLVLYSLAKAGRIAVSSRGFGELRQQGDVQYVVEDQYSHVCFDNVLFPAVPVAVMSAPEAGVMPTVNIQTVTEDLKTLIRQAYDRNPGNEDLKSLAASVGLPTLPAAAPSPPPVDIAAMIALHQAKLKKTPFSV